MIHGTQGFFLERARSMRRLALLCGALGLALFAGFSLLPRTPVGRALRDPLRWGFEGPEQYVARIHLQGLPGRARTLREVGQVLERSTRRGGSPTPRPSRDPRSAPETRPRIEGPGEALEDLLARAYARRTDVPIVRSQDLVIEKLVRPIYPEEARARNIEGRVAVMALVDTTGRVVEVQVLEGESHARTTFGQAASEAVWQCEFRPYRVDGRTQEVYAMFRFNFTIY